MRRRWPRARLGELVKVSREAIQPTRLRDAQVIYLGLENIAPVTGELLEHVRRERAGVKSRSRVFRPHCILFGRLRPYLRKVYLAHPPAAEGICSAEFIVLVPDRERMLPELLRAMLASQAFCAQLTRFQTGAALPRVSEKDLLSLEVPVPPLSEQIRRVRRLQQIAESLREARLRTQQLTGEIDACVRELSR